ncbi:DUF1659 domain-containing protein [Clostridium arbusti]|uniref:DUF1659 domain-containing protein n=1 Tax=Clostridium arbusti TaxID=1137848 RepID=UPI0002888672|nr:DUF1659 domain-containing protein [Clostridium arbusti]
MATVASHKVSSSLVIELAAGKDENGKDIITRLNLGKVDPTAADQDIYDVVTSIIEVLDYPVQTIQKIDNSLLTDQ